MRYGHDLLLREPGGEPGGDPTPPDPAKELEALKAQLEAATQEREAQQIEAKKAKEEQAQIQNQLDTMMAGEKKREQDRLRKSGDYQKLYEVSEKAREAAEAKAMKTADAFVLTIKQQEVREAALKANILPGALSDLSLLELEGVQHAITDQNGIVVQGAEQFVAKVKETRPHWFSTGKPPNVDNGAPGGTIPVGGKMTGAQLLELQTKDPEQYKAMMAKLTGAKAKS